MTEETYVIEPVKFKVIIKAVFKNKWNIKL